MFTGKKFFMMLVIIFALCLSVSACAEVREAQKVKIGVMNNNMTEKEFRTMIDAIIKWSVCAPNHENGIILKFYEEFLAMIMALSVEEVDEIEVPKPTGEYIISMNPEYKISCVLRSIQSNFVFGFLKDRDEELRDKFNKALRDMRSDRTLDALQKKYFLNPSIEDLEPVQFESFPYAQTVKIAVTGDVPPIDYVTPDDRPAGFNTAILAEIGRRLKVNIEIIDIHSGSRTAALTSGRVDVVFWYITMNDGDAKILTFPEHVIVSEPYYSLDTFVHVRRR